MKSSTHILWKGVLLFIIIFCSYSNFLIAQSNTKFSFTGKTGIGILFSDVDDNKANLVNSIGFDYNPNNKFSLGINFTHGKFEADEGENGLMRNYSGNQSIFTVKGVASIFAIFPNLKKPLNFDFRSGINLGMVSSKLTTGNSQEQTTVDVTNSAFLSGVNYQFLFELSPKLSLIVEDEFYFTFNDGSDGYDLNKKNDFFALVSLGLRAKLGKEIKHKRTSTHSPSHKKGRSSGHTTKKSGHKSTSHHNTSQTKSTTNTTTTKPVIKKEEVINKPAKNYDEWEFYANKEGVKIYVMWLEQEKYVSVKFINSSTINVDVSFKPYFVKKNGAKTAYNSFLNNVHIEHNTSEIIKIDFGTLNVADIKLDLSNLTVQK